MPSDAFEFPVSTVAVSSAVCVAGERAVYCVLQTTCQCSRVIPEWMNMLRATMNGCVAASPVSVALLPIPARNRSELTPSCTRAAAEIIKRRRQQSEEEAEERVYGQPESQPVSTLPQHYLHEER